jgi:DNA-binding IclR family transcriptional regulator
VRGRILKTLVDESPLCAAEIVKRSGMDRERIMKNLADLEREGFIRKQGRNYLIPH